MSERFDAQIVTLPAGRFPPKPREAPPAATCPHCGGAIDAGPPAQPEEAPHP
jgi:hypothetical protein